MKEQICIGVKDVKSGDEGDGSVVGSFSEVKSFSSNFAHNHNPSEWLKQSKHIFSYAEHIVDDFECEALRKRDVNTYSGAARQGRIWECSLHVLEVLLEKDLNHMGNPLRLNTPTAQERGLKRSTNYAKFPM
ncbi:hypothetical protein VNO77_44457 [Canavalia gladiata]|uniref:Uncharacterized protein n=1 Tax=Canavalia gladiata TaxID=3824 RepID=A0AAN9JVZ6_CANGL